MHDLAMLREDDLNRFYTRDIIGDLLVDQLNEVVINSFLDLGAGDGSLSRSVFKRWKNATGVTIDLDSGIKPDLGSDHSYKHFHYFLDILKSDLKVIGDKHGTFDLAVCNPPFFKPDWIKEHSDFIDEVNLLVGLPKKTDLNAEIIFLAQNLRMLRVGGQLAIILPDNIITGHRFANFRSELTQKHCIQKVVQLPSHSCHWTEARCFVLFIKKSTKQAQSIKLLKLNKDQSYSKVISIPFEAAKQRLDYEYHAARTALGDNLSNLMVCGAEIRRGSVSSAQARNLSFQTFHTSDFKEIMSDGTISFPDENNHLAPNKYIECISGDILLARIDRKLHKKVAIVKSGSAVITDCVYRVRLPESIRELAFQALRSEEGAYALRAVTKGVGARLLGKADLLQLPLKIHHGTTLPKSTVLESHRPLF